MNEMKKRKLLSTLGIIILVIASYAAYRAYVAKRIANAAWPVIDGGTYESSVTRGGVTSLVPGDEIYESGVLEGGIPALTNPKYTSVLSADAVLADSLSGFDLEIGGEHRFYPVQIMNWHEVVNDTIDSRHVAITYCPLCGTGVVYDQNINMTSVDLVATGKVYNNNTILKDIRSGSLFLQATGEAIQGEWTGESLAVIPSRMMTWEVWKTKYPSGLVLSTDTGFERDYTRHPYGNYDTSKGLYFPINHHSTDFTPKWVVYSVNDETHGLAFSDIVLLGTGLNSAKLGDRAVIAVYDFDLQLARVFGAEGKTFSYDFAKKRLTDNETGSVWNNEGRAISGSLKGTQLEELPVQRGFWFCIAAMHPTWKAVTTATPVEESTATVSE
jgi:hypothetical protein